MVSTLYTVIIIDDDPQWRTVLSLIIKEQSDFKLIAEATNGKEATMLIDHYMPQVIILDIVMPDYDGAAVLKYIKSIPNYRPFIYVITGMRAPSIINMLEEIKVDCYDIKPVEVNNVIKNLSGISKSEKHSLMDSDYLDVTETVETILINVGIPIRLIGFAYIKTAIIYSLDDSLFLREITTKAYPSVARVYNATKSAVERNIRTAIIACKTNNTLLFQQLYGDSAKICNSNFLLMLSNYVKKVIRGGASVDKPDFLENC